MVRRLTAHRWTWIAVLGAVGAACFELFLGIAWSVERRWPIPDSVPTWALWVVVVFLTTALLWLLLEPLRISAKQLTFALRYPPVWVSVAIALVLVTLRRISNPAVLRPAIWIHVPYWAVL